MPYIDPLRRPTVAKNLYQIFNPGELNYSLTLVMLDAFKRYPKYDTIHCLKRDFVTDPKNNKALQALRKELSDRFTVADIYAAAALAFDEFYRRVGVAYEGSKIVSNQDMPEYQEILKGIHDGFDDKTRTVDSDHNHIGISGGSDRNTSTVEDAASSPAHPSAPDSQQVTP